MVNKTIYSIALIAVIALMGCSRSAEKSFDIQEREEINDSLRSGNHKWVSQKTEELKRKALDSGDSLRWAYYLTEEAAAAYFEGDAAGIPSKVDSVLSWARPSSGSSDLRNLLRRAYRIKGSYYQQYSFNPDSAVHYHLESLKYAETSDPADYVVALTNIADAYKLNARYPEAADVYNRAVFYADSVGLEAKKREMIYSGLAGTYTAMGDYRDAGEWWDKTMELYPYMDPYARFYNLNNLGNYYYKSKDYGESLKTFQHLESFLDSIGASDWERNFCKVNLADVYLSMDTLDKANKLLSETVPFFEQRIPNSVPLSHIHNLQMKLATKQGHIPEVEGMIARHPLNDTLRNEQLEGRLSALSEFYQKTGQWQKAFQAQLKLERLQDSVVSQNVRQIIGTQKLANERDRQILTLKADNSAKESRIFRLWMILGLSLVALAVLVLVIITVKLRNSRREDRMLKKIISLRMESVKNRITPHFIYNALNQELLARQRGQESSLPALVGLLRRQQFMTENVADSLSEELAFMRDYIEVASQRLTAPFQFVENIDESIPLDEVRLPAMSLQILAENAFKHSFPGLPENEARRLWVEVIREEGKILIRVTSNTSSEEGPRSNSPGLGLRIITETADYMNSTSKSNISFTAGPDTPGFWTAEITVDQK